MEEKWIVPVIKGLDILFDKVIMDFINQLEKLSLKYEETMKDIDNKIQENEDELSKMIDELTGSSFDLKGLNDLKQLISKEN